MIQNWVRKIAENVLSEKCDTKKNGERQNGTKTQNYKSVTKNQGKKMLQKLMLDQAIKVEVKRR